MKLVSTDTSPNADAFPTIATSPAGASDLLLALRRCPGCGYRMAGLPQAEVCPECGGRVSRDMLFLCGFVWGEPAALRNAGHRSIPRLLLSVSVGLLPVLYITLILLTTRWKGEASQWMLVAAAATSLITYAVAATSADPAGTMLARLGRDGFSEVSRSNPSPSAWLGRLASVLLFFLPGIAGGVLALVKPGLPEFFPIGLAAIQFVMVLFYLAGRGAGRRPVDGSSEPSVRAARFVQPWASALSAQLEQVDEEHARLQVLPIQRFWTLEISTTASPVDLEFPCTPEELAKLKALLGRWRHGGPAASVTPTPA